MNTLDAEVGFFQSNSSHTVLYRVLLVASLAGNTDIEAIKEIYRENAGPGSQGLLSQLHEPPLQSYNTPDNNFIFIMASLV